MINSPFIVTRFAHGSAGKFLSTLLQTSNKVDHWSVTVQSNKNNPELLKPILQEYVQRSFPSDHSVHLKSEPMVPYDVSLYSTSYPRGNDVTLDQYLKNAQAANDSRFLSCHENDLIPNIVFSKPNIPNFCYNTKVVTILITSELERSWVNSALQAKHFLESEDSIIYVPNSPMHCNFSSLPTVLKYKNKYKFDKSEKQLLLQMLDSNYKNTDWFTDPEKFTEVDGLLNLDNQFINLSDILDIDKLIPVLSFIFDYFKLGQLDEKLIRPMHKIYLDNHATI